MICREYIEAMGGDIWVESTVGRGSDLQFCLPRATTRRREGCLTRYTESGR